MNRKLTYIGLLTGIATILFSLESLIPMPIPWFRPGFANLLTLLALAWWGWKEAFVILMLRIFLGSLLAGKLFQPAFFLSISGGGASLFIMAVLIPLRPARMGFIGISIIGAALHNMIQLLTAYAFFMNHTAIFHFTSVFLLTAVITGALTGFLAELLDNRLGYQFSAIGSHAELPRKH